MTKFAVLGLLAVALCGCGATSRDWSKPGASIAQTDHDFRECSYQADLATPDTGGGVIIARRGDDALAAAIGSGIATGVAQGMRVSSLRRQCLEIRGYRQAS